MQILNNYLPSVPRGWGIDCHDYAIEANKGHLGKLWLYNPLNY